MEEIKKLDAKLLQSKLDSLKKELCMLKIYSKTSGVEKPHIYKNLKKDIARIMTEKMMRFNHDDK